VPYIILNDEQAQVVSSAVQPAEVRDGQGNILGVLSPIWTAEDLADAKRIRASDQPWHTTEEVLARLRSLEQR
jgi:hypothetical protein